MGTGDPRKTNAYTGFVFQQRNEKSFILMAVSCKCHKIDLPLAPKFVFGIFKIWGYNGLME